jgi:hypothetical protein
MFFLNDISTYYIADDEYEGHPNLVLDALRENQHYVKLKKSIF